VADEEPTTSELSSAWEDEVSVIEILKGDRGLGFSILDFQVCFAWIFFAM